MEPVSGKVAGIDVHKKMLAVVVAERRDPEGTRQQRKFLTIASGLEQLRQWLEQQQVREVAMESTAQYWRPVWLELEGRMKLHLAQPRSTAARQGRKSDFRDAFRILRRLVADDLTVSYVPGPEQRQWRSLSRTRTQLVEDRTRIRNQVECIWEECRIKLSSFVSDLLGVTSRRVLHALAEGKQTAAELATMAAQYLEASEEQLRDALSGKMSATHCGLLKMHLNRIEALDREIVTLEKELGNVLSPHQAAVERLCTLPGVNVVAAEQILPEVGLRAEAFAGPEKLASWVGFCPGREESAERSPTNRCPRGNRALRRLLTQVAFAAVRSKGCFFQHLFRRLVPRLGVRKAIRAVAHRITRLIWKILHEGVEYQERGSVAPDPRSRQRRQQRLVRELRRLGYNVTLTARAAAQA